MSNILIIKHGSLGDLIQANGAIEDIKKSNSKSKIVLLTSSPYFELMNACPYVDEVLVDKRLSRLNLFYLFGLKKKLESYNFTHVFDLQNSNRTRFYRRYLLKKPIWSSTDTTLEPGQKKSDFDQAPVLERMEIQLKKSGIKTVNIMKPNLNWAVVNIRHITKHYFDGKYILLFPFCSANPSRGSRLSKYCSFEIPNLNLLFLARLLEQQQKSQILELLPLSLVSFEFHVVFHTTRLSDF